MTYRGEARTVQDRFAGAMTSRDRITRGRAGKELTPPSKSRKHGAKAGRRKGGGRGGRH